MKISVIIPVYKKPKYIIDIAKKILRNDYENKEIIIVIDGEITPEIKMALESLEGKIQIIYPNVHTGKARALNNAVKNISTDVILFLDNDILFPDDPLFLSKLMMEMNTYDIVEMPKEVIAESFFSAMIGYEYLCFALASLIFSKISGRSPGLIGAAFAVKKEIFDKLGGFRSVIYEDGDFGARAFYIHTRYSYNPRFKVKNSMPNTLSDWVSQRKRWTLINVLWFKDNFLPLLRSVFKHPSLILSLFIIILPTLLSFLLLIILNHLKLTFLLPAFFMAEQSLQFLAGIFLLFAHYSNILQGIISVALSLIISVLCYLSFALFIKFRFNIFEYILFYFIYFPLLVIINAVMFIVVLLFNKKDIKLEWKI